MLRSENPIYRQLPSQSNVDRASGQSGDLRPFRNRHRFPVMREHCHRTWRSLASIIRLLFSSPPHAISRFVVSVVIAALYGICTSRSFAHISQKALKGISPSFANYDSSSAVGTKATMIAILAPLDHGSPTYISKAMRHSMRRTSLFGRVNDQASTATNDTFYKCASASDFSASAFAITIPKNETVFVPACKTADSQSREYLAFKVWRSLVKLRRSEGFGSINLSHYMTLHERVVQWLEPHGVDSTVSARFILSGHKENSHGR